MTFIPSFIQICIVIFPFLNHRPVFHHCTTVSLCSSSPVYLFTTALSADFFFSKIFSAFHNPTCGFFWLWFFTHEHLGLLPAPPNLPHPSSFFFNFNIIQLLGESLKYYLSQCQWKIFKIPRGFSLYLVGSKGFLKFGKFYIFSKIIFHTILSQKKKKKMLGV